FFQAEDGIRDRNVTGVQTCALPICEILDGLGPTPVAEELLTQVRASAQGAPDDMVACVLSPRAATREEHVHVEELEVDASTLAQIGRASCRGRVERGGVAGAGRS